MTEEKKTIREMVNAVRDEAMRAEDLLPDRAAELLVKLSALFGNCNDELRRREMAYNQVLMLSYDTELKSNRAKIRAEASPSYEAKIEAKHTKELILELIRSLKFFLKNKEEKKRWSGF